MLTWESPKEMIFEMPVRSRVPRFSVSRAAHASALPETRATPARARECTLSSRRCAGGSRSRIRTRPDCAFDRSESNRRTFNAQGSLRPHIASAFRANATPCPLVGVV